MTIDKGGLEMKETILRGQEVTFTAAWLSMKNPIDHM